MDKMKMTVKGDTLAGHIMTLVVTVNICMIDGRPRTKKEAMEAMTDVTEKLNRGLFDNLLVVTSDAITKSKVSDTRWPRLFVPSLCASDVGDFVRSARS